MRELACDYKVTGRLPQPPTHREIYRAETKTDKFPYCLPAWKVALCGSGVITDSERETQTKTDRETEKDTDRDRVCVCVRVCVCPTLSRHS